MANNPFDPPIIQVKKTLERGGMAGANKGFGSVRSSSPSSRPGPGPQTIEEMDDVDLETTSPESWSMLGWNGTEWVPVPETEPTYGQTLVWNGTTWVPGDAGGGGGGGGGGRDIRWAVPQGWTVVDEFNDSALNPAWVRVDASGTASKVTWTEDADSLSMRHNGVADPAAHTHGLVHPIGTAMAVGDAFVTYFSMLKSGGNYAMAGLILSDGVTWGAGKQVMGMAHNNGDSALSNYPRGQTNWNTDEYPGTSYGYTTPMVGQYQRLVRTGTSTWRLDCSADGVSWLIGPASITKVVEPTHVGFYAATWGGNVQYLTSYEFLRRVSGVT